MRPKVRLLYIACASYWQQIFRLTRGSIDLQTDPGSSSPFTEPRRTYGNGRETASGARGAVPAHHFLTEVISLLWVRWFEIPVLRRGRQDSRFHLLKRGREGGELATMSRCCHHLPLWVRQAWKLAVLGGGTRSRRGCLLLIDSVWLNNNSEKLSEIK